ncbi:class I SAM-dependent methyltransferase [Saccharopolyspora hirsuta]|uniref:Class I SAM-dependent methyltransferase n=1 Tax=Saccharopolyspora hirsuta TaxID=1837 RepID=A0A5M7C1L2_SACHI|nr:class I SAM-dependent methyltransferase [Saccharopolyspora hirsuta]KAA5835949.1 class I SAM-dependent methyltransferase [Saccharopolyspora hirsuta]
MTQRARAVRVRCHYKRVDSSAPVEMLHRFRTLTGKRAAGQVLDVGAFDPEDLLGYRHVRYLALLGASAEVSRVRADLAVDPVDADPAQLPFPDDAFDVVVSRFSLCCTAKPRAVLQEVGRVLRPVGQLLFLEHTRAPGVVGRAQDEAQEMLQGTRLCRLNVEVLLQVQMAGLVVRRADWFWPAAQVRVPLVQGIATHPDPQYERELGWLRDSIGRTGDPPWPGR